MFGLPHASLYDCSPPVHLGKKLAGCLAVVVAVAAPAAGQQRGFQPSDYYRLASVSEPAMSPTGAYVAFTVTRVIEEENRRHREVWLQPLSGGRPDGEAIRFSDPTSESSAPAWSPDGSLLSFRSSRGDDTQPHLVPASERAGWRGLPHRRRGGRAGVVAQRPEHRLHPGSGGGWR